MEFCQGQTPTFVKSAELSTTELSKLFTYRDNQHNDEQKDNTPKVALRLPVVTKDTIVSRKTIKTMGQFKKKHVSRVIFKKCTYHYKTLHEKIYLSKGTTNQKEVAKLSCCLYGTEFEMLLKKLTLKYFVIIRSVNPTKISSKKYKSNYKINKNCDYKSYPHYCKDILSDFPQGKYETRINYLSASCSKKDMINCIVQTKPKQNCNVISHKYIIANMYTLKKCMSNQSLLRNIQNVCNFFEEKKIKPKITLFKDSTNLSFLISSTQHRCVPIMDLFIKKNDTVKLTKLTVGDQRSIWESLYTFSPDSSSIKKHIFLSNKYSLSNVYYNRSCELQEKLMKKSASSWDENFKNYLDILIDNLIKKRSSHNNNWKYFTLQFISKLNANFKRQCSHYSVFMDIKQSTGHFPKETISIQSLSTNSNEDILRGTKENILNANCDSKSRKKKENISFSSAFKKLSSIVCRVRSVPNQDVKSIIKLRCLKENVVYQTRLSPINIGNANLLRDTSNRDTKYFKKWINIITHMYIIASSHEINKSNVTDSELFKIKKQTSGLFLDIHKHAEYKICLQSLFKDASKSSSHKASRNISFVLPEDKEPSRTCIMPAHSKHTCCINQHGFDESQYKLSNCYHNKRTPRKFKNKLCNTNSPIKVELPTSRGVDRVSNCAQCQIDSDKSIQTSYGRCSIKDGKEKKPKVFRDFRKPRKIIKKLPIRPLSSKRRKFFREPEETVIEIGNYKKDPSTDAIQCEDKKNHRTLWNKICQKFIDKHGSQRAVKKTPREQCEILAEDEEEYELTFSDFQCMDENQLKDIICELKKAALPNNSTTVCPSSSTMWLKSGLETDSSDICGGEDIMICFDDPSNLTCPSSSSFDSISEYKQQGINFLMHPNSFNRAKFYRLFRSNETD